MLNSDDRRNLSLARRELTAKRGSRVKQRSALLVSIFLLGAVVVVVAWNEGLLGPRDSNAGPRWQGDQATFSLPYDSTRYRKAGRP